MGVLLIAVVLLSGFRDGQSDGGERFAFGWKAEQLARNVFYGRLASKTSRMIFDCQSKYGLKVKRA